jgi:DNA (cytosine-5)-methyltransferase 1
MTLTFGSLFAGVGGFDMGFEQAGWDCKFQVEWDKNCQQILNKHWPDVPKWLDVSDVNGAEIPPVDCIIFGSPCQDLSVAGKRAGLEGERSGLFHEAVRIIKEMRDATNGTFPRWTVWENVAGALSSNNGRDFGTVINEMAKAGAHLQEFALLDAQHFGVPQRRRRVFLISCFDPATADRCPDPLLPVTESLRGDTKKGKQKRQNAALTLTEGVGGDGAIVNAIGASIYHKSTVVNQDVNCGHLVTEGGILGSDIVGSLNTSDAKMISNQYVNENKCVVEPYVKSRRAQSATDDETWVHGEVNPTLNSFDVGDTRSTTVVVGSLQARDHKGVNHEGARDGKLIIEQPMLIDGTRVDDVRVYEPPVQTLGARMGTGGNNVPNVMQPEPTMAVRRLTPLECERLMGWPDDHTRYKADGTEQADTHRYKQCGNGVASPVARWVAEQIAKVEYAEG